MPVRVYVLLFCTCLTAYGLLFHGESWNSMTRVAVTLSILRSGTVTIDEFADLTGDKAEALGHFVSDKAPGVSLLALPVTAFADGIIRGIGGDPELVNTRVVDGEARSRPTPMLFLLQWLATIGTSGVFSALAVLAFGNALIRLRVAPGIALGFSVVVALGTLQWGWSATFFGHAAAGAFLCLAFWAIVRLDAVDRATRLAFSGLAGFFSGLAVITEFPTAVAAACLGSFALWRLMAKRRGDWPSVVGIAAVGAASPLLVLATYNELAFGSPLNVSYASVVGFEGMKVGLFGIGVPRLDVLFEIVFGGNRGIVWLMPIVLMFPWALLVAGRRLPDVAILSATIVVAFFLINAGYVYWDGGWATGPRHVVPAIWFIVLPVALAYADFPHWARPIVVLLAVLGVLANLIAATTDMFTPNSVAGVSLFTWLVPQLLSGTNSAIVFEPLVSGRFVALAVYMAIVGALAAATFYALPRSAPRGPIGTARG